MRWGERGDHAVLQHDCSTLRVRVVGCIEHFYWNPCDPFGPPFAYMDLYLFRDLDRRGLSRIASLSLPSSGIR